MSHPTGTILEDRGRVKCWPPLTPAMRKVAELLATGHSQPSVARKLGLAQTTVSYHVRQAGLRIPGNKPARLKLIAWYERSPTSWARKNQNPLRGLIADC